MIIDRALLLAGLAASLAFPSAVSAAPRTFVSGKGADSGACAITQPCRSFAYAIGQTDAGGDIAVLDTAGYGPVTINKSISIINQDGVEAGVSVSGSGAGITIQGASFSDTVTLRGLTITGSGSGAIGIADDVGATVLVQNCTIRGMTQAGIAVTPNSGGTVVITDTTVSGNQGDGILATASSSNTLTVTISHSKVVQNGFSTTGNGIHVKGLSASYGFVSIDTSLIAQNGTGLYVEASNPDAVAVLLSEDRLVLNRKSMYVGASTTVTLEKTTSASTGGTTNNGTIQSFGDNAINEPVSGNTAAEIPLQ